MSKARILDAVSRLDLQATRELLKAQPSLISATDRRGRNLLLLACAASCPALTVTEAVSARLVTLLLDQGLDVDSAVVADDYPCNSVWFATARGRNVTLVKLLVKRGATPRGLFAAGWHEDLGIMKALLALGAPIDENAEDETPFLHCWKNRKFAGAKLLVRKGADVNFQDRKGRTALHYGVEKDFEPALLKFLVGSGASPDIKDRDGLSPRIKASRKRDKRLIKALL